MININIVRPSFEADAADFIISNRPERTLSGSGWDWERTTKMRGGAYSARLRLFEDFDDIGWDQIFSKWLGFRIEEGQANDWNGIIRAIEMTRNGVTRRVSLDYVANRVRAVYRDDSGEQQVTAWNEHRYSQNRFGVIERTLFVDGSLDEADQLVASYVNQRAMPLADIVDINPSGEDLLVIEAVGLSYLLTQYHPDVQGMIDAGNDQIDEIMASIVNGHPYLRSGGIRGNSFTLTEVEPYRTAMEYVNALCDLGGPNGEPYTFSINKFNQLAFYPISNEVVHRVKNGEVVDRSGTQPANPRFVKPGVYSIEGLPSGIRPDSWLQSTNNVVIDEVTLTTEGELNLGAPRGAFVGGSGLSFGGSSQTFNLKSTSDGEGNPGQLLKTTADGDLGVRALALNGAAVFSGSDDAVALSDQAAILATDSRNMIVLNAYNDGSWRYRAGGRAFMIRLDSVSGIQMFAAVSGTAGALISWTLLETWS